MLKMKACYDAKITLTWCLLKIEQTCKLVKKQTLVFPLYNRKIQTKPRHQFSSTRQTQINTWGTSTVSWLWCDCDLLSDMPGHGGARL